MAGRGLGPGRPGRHRPLLPSHRTLLAPTPARGPWGHQPALLAASPRCLAGPGQAGGQQVRAARGQHHPGGFVMGAPHSAPSAPSPPCRQRHASSLGSEPPSCPRAGPDRPGLSQGPSSTSECPKPSDCSSPCRPWCRGPPSPGLLQKEPAGPAGAGPDQTVLPAAAHALSPRPACAPWSRGQDARRERLTLVSADSGAQAHLLGPQDLPADKSWGQDSSGRRHGRRDDQTRCRGVGRQLRTARREEPEAS